MVCDASLVPADACDASSLTESCDSGRFALLLVAWDVVSDIESGGAALPPGENVTAELGSSTSAVVAESLSFCAESGMLPDRFGCRDCRDCLEP
jgi:hypothetical protein